MTERLQKILSARGVCSRRKAEEWISAGRVAVNGRTALLGQSADPDADEIRIDGRLLPPEKRLVYIMLHKPKGFVTTLSDERGRHCASELVKDCGVRVYPVGRLDMDSEGLLLFTNDGKFANRMMHPSHEVSKIYRVLVENYSEEGVKKLSLPVTLDGYTIRKPQVRVIRAKEDIRKAELEVIIHEGRNRQVRRMCEIAGMPVLRLLRTGEGPLRLNGLSAGKWRYLTEEEVEALK